MAKCIVSGMGVGEVLKTVDGSSYKWAKTFDNVIVSIPRNGDRGLHSKEKIVGNIPTNGAADIVVCIDVSYCSIGGLVYTYDGWKSISSLTFTKTSVVKNVGVNAWQTIITGTDNPNQIGPVSGMVRITSDGNLILRMSCGGSGFDESAFAASLSVFLI